MILEPNGVLALKPAAYYRALDWPEFRVWCHYNARYAIPTVELIDWLKNFIGDRSAIEVGSGAGDFCYRLNINGTDSKIQDDPDVALYYRAMGQPTIKYPRWVEKMDAISAVKRYRPQVVLACWVTHWLDPSVAHRPETVGCMFGVKEEELLDLVDTYIFVGNLNVHGEKPILKRKHETHALPFLVSRSQHPEGDRLFVWRDR